MTIPREARARYAALVRMLRSASITEAETRNVRKRLDELESRFPGIGNDPGQTEQIPPTATKISPFMQSIYDRVVEPAVTAAVTAAGERLSAAIRDFDLEIPMKPSTSAGGNAGPFLKSLRKAFKHPTKLDELLTQVSVSDEALAEFGDRLEKVVEAMSKNGGEDLLEEDTALPRYRAYLDARELLGDEEEAHRGLCLPLTVQIPIWTVIPPSETVAEHRASALGEAIYEALAELFADDEDAEEGDEDVEDDDSD